MSDNGWVTAPEGAAAEVADANLAAADSGKLLAHGIAICMPLGG